MCVGTCACALGHSVMSDYFETSYTKAHHAFLSMAFPRLEYWNELLFPLPGDLPDPEIEPTSPVSPVEAGRLFTTDPPRKTL